MAAGNRIAARQRAVTSDIIEKYRALPVANVSDSMGRMTAGGACLRPFHRGGILAGPAITVKARPGDNLMVHAALDRAQPGDVIVVDTGGDMTNAIIGELMVAHAAYLRLGGFVINGAIRDVAAIRAGDFPIYALGVSHRGPYKDGPGEVNFPVAIAGMVVMPGDLVLGDEDGLVVVPFDDVEAVYDAATKKHAAETAQLERIAIGQNDRRWVQQALVASGCEFRDA
jgi:RraA family protein